MKPCAVICFAYAFLLLPAASLSAQSDTSWEKTYPVSPHPTLRFEVGDSSLRVHPCSGCQAVRVHITAVGTTLSRYTLDESQTGNIIHLALKEKPHVGLRVDWNTHAQVTVDVEAPPEVTVQATASDGALDVQGIRGAVTLKTSDGSQTLQDVSGELHLSGSDGHVTVQRSSGTIEARFSDAHLNISGAFSALQLHTSDGPVRIELAEVRISPRPPPSRPATDPLPSSFRIPSPPIWTCTPATAVSTAHFSSSITTPQRVVTKFTASSTAEAPRSPSIPATAVSGWLDPDTVPPYAEA